MSEEGKKKKDKVEPEEHFSGTKIAADPLLAKWIDKQWSRGEHLQRIDVVEYFTRGPNRGFAQVVDWEIFTNGHEMNLEEATDLSNRFIGNAQVNCDRIHKKDMTYYVRAYDKGRSPLATDPNGGPGGDPVDTFPLHLRPKILYAKSQFEAGSDDEGKSSQETMALAYFEKAVGAYQWDRQREDQNMGDLVITLMAERREERLWMREIFGMFTNTMKDWSQAQREREEALSNKPERDAKTEILKIKSEMLRDGFRVGKNFLTGAMSSLFGNRSLPTDTTQPSPPNGNGGPPIVEPGMTQEKAILDEFFNDCKNAKVDIALFGNWEQSETGAKLTKPGVFDPAQFEVLFKVWKGYLHADALDALMMDSGSPLAVRMEQFAAAQAVEGMSDGIGASLVMLMKIRKDKRVDPATAAGATPPTQPAAPTPASQPADPKEVNDDV